MDERENTGALGQKLFGEEIAAEVGIGALVVEKSAEAFLVGGERFFQSALINLPCGFPIELEGAVGSLTFAGIFILHPLESLPHRHGRDHWLGILRTKRGCQQDCTEKGRKSYHRAERVEPVVIFSTMEFFIT